MVPPCLSGEEFPLESSDYSNLNEGGVTNGRSSWKEQPPLTKLLRDIAYPAIPF